MKALAGSLLMYGSGHIGVVSIAALFSGKPLLIPIFGLILGFIMSEDGKGLLKKSWEESK